MNERVNERLSEIFSIKILNLMNFILSHTGFFVIAKLTEMQQEIKGKSRS